MQYIPLLAALLFAGWHKSPQVNSHEHSSGKYRQVPVLCYHNITDHPRTEDLLWISRARFEQQVKMLHDSGYHAITPEIMYLHVTKGTPLPAKPVMLTFDDAHEEHYSIAAPVLNRYGFKGVFFIITGYIGKSHCLKNAEIKAMSDSGHIVASHTYNHPAITAAGLDWSRQLDSSRATLEKITGKPANYFAYPYGMWNEKAVEQLKQRGFKAAFQLTGKESITDPLFSWRRIMISGASSPAEVEQKMRRWFVF